MPRSRPMSNGYWPMPDIHCGRYPPGTGGNARAAELRHDDVGTMSVGSRCLGVYMADSSDDRRRTMNSWLHSHRRKASSAIMRQFVNTFSTIFSTRHRRVTHIEIGVHPTVSAAHFQVIRNRIRKRCRWLAPPLASFPPNAYFSLFPNSKFQG